MSDQPGYVAPAAWYVDPTTSDHLRWWSGLEWTEHVAPLPDVVSAPTESDRMSAPTESDRMPLPVEADAAPLSRRAQRKAASARTAEPAPPPPPTPLIAPVTAFDWGHEVDKGPSRFPRVVERVDEYRFIPSRWSTASVWLIAFTPWLAILCVGVALMLLAWGSQEYLQYATLALPSLLTFVWAQRDHKRLGAWGHKNVAHWAWSLLGPLGYLIARTVVLLKHTGIGSLPLWIWLVNLFAAAGASVLVLLLLSPLVMVQTN